jgi:hypothetical protein
MNEITMDEIGPFEDGFLKNYKNIWKEKNNSLIFFSHYLS